MIRGYLRLPIWVIPLAVAALVAALGWWGNQELHHTIREDLRSDLAATLRANVIALEIWATNQIKVGRALAGEPGFRMLAMQALEPLPTEKPAETTPPPPSPREDLSRYLRARLDGLGYEMGHVVTPQLLVIATSIAGPTSPGLTVSEDHAAKFSELFDSGHPVIITPFKAGRSAGSRSSVAPPSTQTAANAELSATNSIDRLGGGLAPEPAPRSDTLMQVAVPVRDEQGGIRCALALVIDPDQEFARILSVTRAGRTGETYVFDWDGVMLSRSRFEQQLKELGLIEAQPGANSAAGLRLSDPGANVSKQSAADALEAKDRPLTRIVARAVAGQTGVDVEPSRDYRGVAVVGAWSWLAEHGFGVATQLDAEEAFEPLRVLNLVFVMLFGLLALFAIGLFLASYFGVLWRKRLSQAELKLQQLGQYTLEEKIGEGAMGVVYRARHSLLRRDTAIKLLLPDRADPVSVRRFEREVRLSCQLTHPNTIQVYDYGHTPEGVFYSAMELLRGLNLHDLVAQFGAQPEGRVVYILMHICDALAEAHALGLVHRDIKPANIFVCDRAGLSDWVKVLDFGLVRAYHDGKGNRIHSLAEAVVEGTPLFMPPEAFADSGAADPRSDIYSLGALGYYLLTAQYVFEAESDLELYHKHLTQPPVQPSRRTRNPISAELEETLLRCLEKEPNLRVASVGELRALLLTSPAAHSWQPQDRTSWWARYHAAQQEVLTDPEPQPSAAEHATIRIEMPAG